ncbi:hypothetical protein C8F01DRAFT_269827 [Mycena amicta]|nr:hypothetical protein C8F01DRAFT_269827 [Mycena amicta]
MLHLLLSLSLSVPFALAASSSSHRPSATSSISATGSSSAIGTPSNSAALPVLSNVPSCVTDCLAMAAAQDGCESEVAVDCFCPNPKNYTTALLVCMQSCPDEVSTAEAIVESFCAVAATSTSLSFASFTPSSSSGSESITSSGSTTAPTTTSASASTSPSPSSSGSAGRRVGTSLSGVGVALGTTVLLGAAAVHL